MKYLLQYYNQAERKDEWVTQRRLGVPSLTDNRHLCYTWPTAEAAEQQRPLYEAALKCPLEVVPQPPPDWQIGDQEDEASEKYQAWIEQFPS